MPQNTVKTFRIMIGLPGCGKSTIAAKMVEQHTQFGNNAVIVSTDAICKELYGDESTQGDPNKIFSIARKRVVDSLNGDFDYVIFDATNLKKKYRMELISDIRRRVRSDFETEGYWLAVPYEVCLRRDSERERSVGNKVIRRMYMNFEPPGYEEGFDKIVVNTPDFFDESATDYSVEKFAKDSMNFDQHNKHHTLTLGKHCLATMEYVKEHGGGPFVCKAALLHDNGKIFTASFKNRDGEITDECHYYQHHCVGAYNSVLYTRYGGDSDVYIANLIFYHMRPLVEWKNSESKKKKETSRMSEGFLKDLMLLHEGDKNAH